MRLCPCVRRTRGRKIGPRVPSFVARDGYRGPTRAGKKMYAGDGSTRADKKAGKKYFGGSEGAGEKKKSFRRERKKILASTRTQPTKRLTYSRDFLFLPTYSSQEYLLEGGATIRVFFESEFRRQKIFFESDAKGQKITDKSQSIKM